MTRLLQPRHKSKTIETILTGVSVHILRRHDQDITVFLPELVCGSRPHPPSSTTAQYTGSFTIHNGSRLTQDAAGCDLTRCHPCQPVIDPWDVLKRVCVAVHRIQKASAGFKDCTSSPSAPPSLPCCCVATNCLHTPEACHDQHPSDPNMSLDVGGCQ